MIIEGSIKTQILTVTGVSSELPGLERLPLHTNRVSPWRALAHCSGAWPLVRQRRRRAMLTVVPIRVMVFPATGIQGNLADKAKKLGIAVWKFDEGGA